MRKKLLLCGLMTIATINFIACDDDDDNKSSNNNTTNNNTKKEEGNKTESKLSAEFISSTGCLGSPYDSDDETRAGTKTPNIIYKFDATTGVLDLTLENADLNCAAHPNLDFKFNGDTITFIPKDGIPAGGPVASCFCLFNLTAKITGVQSKVYYIRPSWPIEEEDLKVLELSQKSEGTLSFSPLY